MGGGRGGRRESEREWDNYVSSLEDKEGEEGWYVFESLEEGNE